MIEWASEELEIAEEGCLSLPGVHVEVERPAQVRVRAQDEHGEELVIEAEGLQARVIQHEIDHLDGVLILDRISREAAQAGDARDARGAARRGRGERRGAERRGPAQRRPRRRAWRTVFLGTSEFAAAVLERLADESPHRPALVLTRPDRPRGRGRQLASPPVAERARALGLALEQPESVNDPEARELIAARAARADARRSSCARSAR